MKEHELMMRVRRLIGTTPCTCYNPGDSELALECERCELLALTLEPASVREPRAVNAQIEAVAKVLQAEAASDSRLPQQGLANWAALADRIVGALTRVALQSTERT